MIPQYKMLLYTTNLMPHSRMVLRHALSIAQRYKAKIYIVHVVPEMDQSHRTYLSAVIGEEKYKQMGKTLDEAVTQKIQARLTKFTEDELQDNPEYMDSVVGVEILHGHPTDRILAMAEKLDADLLVFGSHKSAGGVMGLLGSVVKRVLRRSCRPVLVVPVGE